MLLTIFIFLVETLWSPMIMSLIKFPKVWVSMTAIIFCLSILWKACITWHFWATNTKLTFSWKITPLGAIPPLNPLFRPYFFMQPIQSWYSDWPYHVPEPWLWLEQDNFSHSLGIGMLCLNLTAWGLSRSAFYIHVWFNIASTKSQFNRMPYI